MKGEEIKIIVKIFIVIICLIALVYFGQAQKARKVKEIRIKVKYEKGEISQADYENIKKQNTLLRTLFNPKEVLGVD